MSNTQPYRPWGELDWALGLSAQKSWHFLGCIGTEKRSVSSVINLHSKKLISQIDLVRIRDTKSTEPKAEEAAIIEQFKACADAGIITKVNEFALQAPLNGSTWPNGFNFSGKANVCIDISSFPKRFFFSAVRSALRSVDVKNLLVLYTKPNSYPPTEISSDPDDWSTMDNFGIIDPDIEREVDSHLIINAGFMVGGLIKHLADRTGDFRSNILIPFPAEPWSSARRSWESAQSIEESLQIPRDENGRGRNPTYHRIGALDASTAFETLLGLTQQGSRAAALAPLGPKPISLAFCLLASQSEKHPVYYAQPKAYAVNYSEGHEKTYAYWIKHGGENLYQL